MDGDDIAQVTFRLHVDTGARERVVARTVAQRSMQPLGATLARALRLPVTVLPAPDDPDAYALAPEGGTRGSFTVGEAALLRALPTDDSTASARAGRARSDVAMDIIDDLLRPALGNFVDALRTPAGRGGAQ